MLLCSSCCCLYDLCCPSNSNFACNCLRLLIDNVLILGWYIPFVASSSVYLYSSISGYIIALSLFCVFLGIKNLINGVSLNPVCSISIINLSSFFVSSFVLVHIVLDFDNWVSPYNLRYVFNVIFILLSFLSVLTFSVVITLHGNNL